MRESIVQGLTCMVHLQDKMILGQYWVLLSWVPTPVRQPVVDCQEILDLVLADIVCNGFRMKDITHTKYHASSLGALSPHCGRDCYTWLRLFHVNRIFLRIGIMFQHKPCWCIFVVEVTGLILTGPHGIFATWCIRAIIESPGTNLCLAVNPSMVYIMIGVVGTSRWTAMR